MASSAITSYGALNNSELWNSARTKAYVDNGLIPSGVTVRCAGCEGLAAILPCIESEPESQITGYTVPDDEGNEAPWYDPGHPESANFAGLLVTNVEVTSPYSRDITDNIGQGSTLGKLKLRGRQITVTGWLLGKTCCSVQYGYRWLTAAIAEPACDDCTGANLDFLDCCPQIHEENDCITTCDEEGNEQIWVRDPSVKTEFQRAEDFWRRMKGVGVVSGVDITNCQGTSCGCGCGSILEVQFILQTSSPWVYSIGEVLLNKQQITPCGEDTDCGIERVRCGDESDEDTRDCTENDRCKKLPLPPDPSLGLANPCACIGLTSQRVWTKADPISTTSWFGATINLDIFAGSKPLRNFTVRVWQNQNDFDPNKVEDQARFTDESACSTLLVSYVPTSGTLHFSGEDRKVTIECEQQLLPAASNVFNIEGQPFDWPDITCAGIVVAIDFDCEETAPDAHVTLTRVDRSL